jgi:anti-sigma regulatory factor (Ser/Thr protein kinase)
MTTGTTGGHVHQGALYATDEEFLAVVVPFLQQGRDAGQPTMTYLDARTTDMLRASMDDTAGISWLDGRGRRANPAEIINNARELLGSYTAEGARQIRVVGSVPHPGSGALWDRWARYEATVNFAYAQFPLWHLCPYDLRSTPASVVEDVFRTHPAICGPDGFPHVNPRYEEPPLFLASRPPVGPDELQTATAPVVDMLDPTLAAARRAARDVAVHAALGLSGLDDLVMAVNETVSNAVMYGVAPVRLRLWAGPGRVVATVEDRGTGPSDPYAGLLPTTATSTGGIGLWLTHRMCSDVTLAGTPDGFTIRFVLEVPDGDSDVDDNR